MSNTSNHAFCQLNKSVGYTRFMEPLRENLMPEPLAPSEDLFAALLARLDDAPAPVAPATPPVIKLAA